MSVYFQRLLRQSGVHLSPPTPPPVSVPPGPPAGPSASSISPPHDVVEVHEERVASPSLPVWSPAPAAESVPFSFVQTSPKSGEPETTAPHSLPPSSDRAAVRGVIQTVDTIERETVTIAPSSARSASAPPAAAAAISTASAHSSTPSTPTGPIPRPEFPAEVMQAVMKWIAAGSASAGSPPAPVQEISEFSEKPTAHASAPPAPAGVPTPREAPKIPDRVIQIVEEHVEETAASHRSEVRAAAAQPTPAFVSPPESPVRVSIGSIQVRIDAPPPAPTRIVQPSGPTRPPPAPRNSAGGLSQLRRHYIIPH